MGLNLITGKKMLTAKDLLLTNLFLMVILGLKRPV